MIEITQFRPMKGDSPPKAQTPADADARGEAFMLEEGPDWEAGGGDGKDTEMASLVKSGADRVMPRTAFEGMSPEAASSEEPDMSPPSEPASTRTGGRNDGALTGSDTPMSGGQGSVSPDLLQPETTGTVSVAQGAVDEQALKSGRHVSRSDQHEPSAAPSKLSETMQPTDAETLTEALPRGSAQASADPAGAENGPLRSGVTAMPEPTPSIGDASPPAPDATSLNSTRQQTPMTQPLPVQTAPVQTVADRLALSVGVMESGRVEVRLDPPELGSVVMEFSSEDGPLHAVIRVEREETLQLMKRHTEVLLAQLAAAGHDSATLEFASASQHQRPEGNGDDDTTPNDAAAPEIDAAAALPTWVTGRLDMRV